MNVLKRQNGKVHHNNDESCNDKNAYSTFFPIKKPKLLDVNQLLHHVFLPESVIFFSTLKYMSKSGNHEGDDDVAVK